MEVVEKKIGDIAILVKTGKTPPSKKEEYYNGDINWYNPGDLDKNKYLSKSKRTITRLAIKDNKATLLPEKTVLIGCIGDIGKLGITTEKSCSNQQLTGVLTNDEVYFEYFYYWLKRNKALLQKNATNAIVPILNNKNLNSINIKFPRSLTDQKRIAKVLSDAEVLISQRKESIKLLDELLKSTFLDMFGDEFSKPLKWNNKIKDIAPTIDNGWSPKCQPIPRKNENEWAVLKLSSVTYKFFDSSKNKLCFPETIIKKKTIPQKGDLLFTRKNTYGLVGSAAYVFENYEKLLLPDTIFRINYEPYKISGIYLWFLLNSEIFSKKVRSLANGAAGSMPNISKAKLLNLDIPTPPMIQQNKFAQIVEQTELIKKHYEESLQELEKLYGSMSQRAFNGDLDLSGVEVEEKGMEYLSMAAEDSAKYGNK